jgi:hydroxyacid-oxoacid transhydrogenase
LRPTLGIIDPNHTRYASPELTSFTGLDVLCHALESFTAVPFKRRGVAPSTPQQRPAYQGCNPISDIWSAFALQQCSLFLNRAVEDNSDDVAREKMCLAATAAGVGFGFFFFFICYSNAFYFVLFSYCISIIILLNTNNNIFK